MKKHTALLAGVFFLIFGASICAAEPGTASATQDAFFKAFVELDFWPKSAKERRFLAVVDLLELREREAWTCASPVIEEYYFSVSLYRDITVTDHQERLFVLDGDLVRAGVHATLRGALMPSRSPVMWSSIQFASVDPIRYGIEVHVASDQKTLDSLSSAARQRNKEIAEVGQLSCSKKEWP